MVLTDGNPEQDSAGRAADARNDAITKALDGFGEDTGATAAPEVESPDPVTEGDAPPDGEREAEPDGQSDDASASDSEGQPALEETVEETQLEAPKNWPQERKEAFEQLPDDAKRIIIDREKEFNKGFTKQAQENADHRKFSERVREQFTDADRQQMQAAGLDEAGAVNQLLQLNRLYNEDPTRYVAGLLNASRDPAGLVREAFAHLQMQPETVFQSQGQDQNADTSQTEGEDEWDDPYLAKIKTDFKNEVQTLKDELQTVKQENQQLKQRYDGDVQSRQQRAVQSLQTVVDEFRSEADDSGNAKFPHYDQLEPQMLELMQSRSFNQQQFASPREKLEAAYDRALWADPSLRQEAIEREAEKRASERQQQNESQRRKSARTVKGNAGASGKTKPGKMGRSEAINAALDQHGLTGGE